MLVKNFIVGTAGHVDHGKSALVKALTGTDPDRLPEEKSRGITIDLGFAHLELPAHEATLHLGIVDVPGHEDFVKNMVAGVGSVDLALMVVAADDGWMPQTEEHLQILTYLGVPAAVVALTKIDLIAGEEAGAVEAIRARLQGTPFAQATIVPTSIITGTGFEELKAALVTALERAPLPRDFGKPRLPADRVFTLHGIGTVVTGTLTGGTLSRGQSVIIQPGGRAARIRTIQSHNREVNGSVPGTRTALNLPDVPVADRGTAEGVYRGAVLTLPGLGTASSTANALLEKSARLMGTKGVGAHPLKDGARVRIHHGSANFPATVHLLKDKELPPGTACLAQLRLERPAFVYAGDRFIVRDWAEQHTIAGGTVLEPDADRRRFRDSSEERFLSRRAAALEDVEIWVVSLLERDGIAQRQTLLLQSNFSANEIAGAVERLEASGNAFVTGEWIASGEAWRNWRTRAADAIVAEHRAHPERGGMPLHQLRSSLEKGLPVPQIFEALVVDLCRHGFVQTGAGIRSATHRPALPPQLQAVGSRLRAVLAAKPCEPPSRKELAGDAASQQALRFLRETGEVVELSDEVVLLSASFNSMRETIIRFIQTHGSATVSDLRQALNTTRRIMMPLLERLDREGVTARQGDRRSLGAGARK